MLNQTEYLQKLIEGAPRCFTLRAQLAGHYAYRHEYDQALACLDELLKVDPNCAMAKFQKGNLLLLKGDYKNGWPLYECLFSAFEQTNPFNMVVLKAYSLMEAVPPRPKWVGQNLKGKKLLVWAPHGAGDSIMMIRYIPLLAGKAESIYVLADGGLAELFSQGWPGVQIFRQPQDIPDFHFHCDTNSLPNAFQTRLETIPNRVPYLLVEPTPVKTTKQRKVGLCWKGNPAYANDQLRSLNFELLRPLLDVGVRFINLQLDVKGERLGQPCERGEELLGNRTNCHGLRSRHQRGHLHRPFGGGSWAAQCGC